MIEKYWITEEKGNDRIILISDNTVFKGNPKRLDFTQKTLEIANNKVPSGLFSLPYSYIREVQMEKGRDYIEIMFGQDSSEHLNIKNESHRSEVFEFLKKSIPNSIYQLDSYSRFRSAKKGLIGLFVAFIIFFWAIFLIFKLERGEEVGEQFIFIMLFVGLGFYNLIILFSIILIIGFTSVYFKIKNPPQKHRIRIKNMR